MEGVGAAIYRPKVDLGARNRHVMDPHQLPRSPLDEPTYNRLKINGVDLGNAYEVAEGKRAPEQAGWPR